MSALLLVIGIVRRTRPDKQDITLSDSDALLGNYLLHMLDGNRMVCQCIVLNVSFLRPVEVVNEGAATGDALLCPRVQAVDGGVCICVDVILSYTAHCYYWTVNRAWEACPL